MNKKNMTQKLIILALALLASVKTQAQQNTESDIPCDVGEIPYQYTMTPAGAVTYQIPIDIYILMQKKCSHTSHLITTACNGKVSWDMDGVLAVFQELLTYPGPFSTTDKPRPFHLKTIN